LSWLQSNKAHFFGYRVTERVAMVTELQSTLSGYRITKRVAKFTENRTRCHNFRLTEPVTMVTELLNALPWL
jgi:hypothetical protein